MDRPSIQGHSGRVRPPKPLPETPKQPLFFFWLRLEISEDILNEDHRRIHDDPEIHRTQGEQIRALAENYEKNDGEEQRKRDVQSNDDRAAQISEKDPLDQKDQQASENQVVQNGVRGDGYQR